MKFPFILLSFFFLTSSFELNGGDGRIIENLTVMDRTHLSGLASGVSFAAPVRLLISLAEKLLPARIRGRGKEEGNSVHQPAEKNGGPVTSPLSPPAQPDPGVLGATDSGIRMEQPDISPILPGMGERELQALKLHNSAIALLKQGEYQEAVKLFQILVDKFHGSVYREAASFLIGDSHFEMGRVDHKEHYAVAVKAYEMAMREYPLSKRAPRALLNAGRSNEALKIFPEAESSYNRLIAGYPQDGAVAEAYFHLGEIKYVYKDYERASAYFKIVVEKFQGTEWAGWSSFKLGDSLYDQIDLINALSLYEKAMREFPLQALYSPQSLLNMGDILFQNREYEEARKKLLKAVNLFPEWKGTDMALARIGDSYYNRGDMAMALYFYSQTVLSYPAGEGAALSKLRMADIAIQKLEAEGASIPGREEAYKLPLDYYREVGENSSLREIAELGLFKLGTTLSNLQQYTSAVEVFQKLLRTYPKGLLSGEALSSLRETLKGLINFKYTHNYFLPVIIIYQEHAQGAFKDFQDVQLLYQVSDSFRHLGLYGKAARILAQALGQPLDAPRREKVVFQLATLNLLSGDYSEAKRLLSLYIKEYSNGPQLREAYRLLGDANYHLNDYQGAFNGYFSSLLIEGDKGNDAQTYYLMGNSVKRLGDDSTAVKAYLKASNHVMKEGSEGSVPAYLPKSRLVLADSLYGAGKFSDAVEEYQRAIAASPGDESVPWATYRLGRSYEELGFKEKAIQAYRSLMEGGKGEKGGLWALLAKERMDDLSWQDKHGNTAR